MAPAGTSPGAAAPIEPGRLEREDFPRATAAGNPGIGATDAEAAYPPRFVAERRERSVPLQPIAESRAEACTAVVESPCSSENGE